MHSGSGHWFDLREKACADHDLGLDRRIRAREVDCRATFPQSKELGSRRDVGYTRANIVREPHKGHRTVTVAMVYNSRMQKNGRPDAE